MLKLEYEPQVLVEDITKLTEMEWKQYRYQGIGGSDAAAVCGISPWKTARDLYEEKVQQKPSAGEEDNWVAKEIGKRLEELVVQIYMKQTGCHPYAIRKMFRHPLYPFMLADFDYFVEIRGKVYAVECKTSFSFHMEEWEDNKIPRHYELQGRHYMAVGNVDGVIFLCLYGNSEQSFLMRYLERDLELEEELIEEETYFWNQCVLKKRPPTYTEATDLVLKSIRKHLGIMDGSEVKLPQAVSDRIISCLRLKEKKAELARQTKALEEQMKQAYIPLQIALNGAQKGTLALGDERYQIGFKKRTTTAINKEGVEAIQLKYPEVYREYAKTSDSYSFYVKKEKAS